MTQVGYFFYVPSISGRTNRAYFPTLNVAVGRAKINGASAVWYREASGVERLVMEVER